MKHSKLIIYFATKIKINESFIFSKREGMPVPPLNLYVQLRDDIGSIWQPCIKCN